MPILVSQNTRNALNDDYYGRSYVATRPAAAILMVEDENVSMPNTDFTIPVGYDGYWSYTLSVALTGLSSVSAGDEITFSADDTAGFFSAIPGSINIYNPHTGVVNTEFTVSGTFLQRFTAGQTIRFYQEQTGVWAITSGTCRAIYKYEGDVGQFN
jgi:hypothetical protein